jgi:hypothetical protein
MHERDFWRMGEINERLALGLFHEAMQARTRGRFEHRMHQAVANYSRAIELYGEAANRGKEARVHRCQAMIAYGGFWFSHEASEKRMLIQECWELTKHALDACEKENDGQEYGMTFNQLSSSAYLAYVLEWDFKIRQKVTSEALEYGEQAVALLSPLEESDELARAYTAIAHHLTVFGDQFVPESDKKETYFQKAIAYWKRAQELSKESALLQLANQPTSIMPWNLDDIIENFRKASVYAEETGDTLLAGNALGNMAAGVYWKSFTIEVPQQSVKMAKKALRYAEHARRQYSSIRFVSPRSGVLWTSEPYSEYFWNMAERETDSNEKRQYLEKAIVHGIQGVKMAENAGYPEIIMFAHLQLSKAFVSLAQIEISLAEKKRLLEEASSHSKRSVSVSEQVIPLDNWNRGVMLIEFANLRAELSLVESDYESKREILEDAISLKEQGLQLCIEGTSHFEKTKDQFIFVALGETQYNQAKLISSLYELTHETQHLKKAVNEFQKAVVSFQKPDLPSRVAECYWKIASCDDSVNEHLKAADSFTLASSSYLQAANKIPQLKGFYEDYALYMKAWSEIERAKHCHRNQEYGLAKRHFEDAADLHKAVAQWRYLTPNYLAWARIEHAEELSRKERCGEAIQAFEQAATLFRETEKSVQKKLDKIENSDENQMATDLLKASSLRYKYCVARISIENAKMLDKKGKHYASAREYATVIDAFEDIADALELGEDAKELTFIAALSRGWEKMMLAEHKDMPILYAESAQLFEKACEHAPNDAARFLALGHSRFCRGLEAGTRFLDTQEIMMYSTTMQCLQSAERYYKKACLKIDAENTKATELLFEAYVHVNNAKKEVDPEKRARLYRLAEAILQESSERYKRAKQPEKKSQVLNVIKTVREEREWALSCAQLLRMSPIVSTAYIQAPAPTPERAVGLNGFENANIQAYLSAPRETVVGNELDIRLDLINVAKSFGLLVRIEGLIPPGLRIVASDPRLSAEDGSLDLAGKRLEALKVDSIKINAQATEPGTITLNPRVVFVDDTGRFRTCKPKPVRMTVKPRQSFNFRTKSAEAILNFLASSYSEDNGKKLPLDLCGWRSLAEVMKNGKLPRSSVYRVGGGRGSAVAELENRGLIEAKMISGERGRGGTIVKLRVCSEKEDIKRYVDQHRSYRKK